MAAAEARGLSTDATTWAKAQPITDRNAKQVLIHLATYADAAGEAWGAIDVLAYEMSISHRRVQEGLELVKGKRDKESGEWVCQPYIVDTGRKKLFEGKLYPIYRLKLEEGPQNTREALQLLRQSSHAAGRTPSDPSHAAGRTPDGTEDATGRTPRDAAGRTQIENLEDNPLTPFEGRAREASFEEFENLERAYPKAGLGFSDRSASWDAYQRLVGDTVDPGELVRAAGRYGTDPLQRKRDYGPVSLQKWLSEGRWRGWRDEEDARPTTAAPGQTPFAAPDDIVATVKRLGLEPWLTGAIYRAEDRTIIVPRQFAAERMVGPNRRQLQAEGLSVEGPQGVVLKSEGVS